MTQNLDDLRKLKFLDPETRDIVEYLEELLVLAKAGQLRAFVFAGRKADGFVITGLNVESSHEMAVLLTYLQSVHARQITINWLTDAGYMHDGNKRR